VPDVLIYGDTYRSPELRHEIPIGIPDAFLYAERNGTRSVVVTAFEVPRLDGLGLDIRTPEHFGLDELLASGVPRADADLAVLIRAAKELGVGGAAVPPGFPVELADALRAEGIELEADRELFDERRRVKSDAELAGIRRAQRACEEGMTAAKEVLAAGEPGLTSEAVRARIEAVFTERGVVADEVIVSHGAQAAIGHEAGSGAIAPGESVVIDLFPKDKESGCYADMTRTFVVGEIADDLREWHRLCKEALDRSLESIRPGVEGADLHRMVCELFHEHGYPTQLSKPQGEVLLDGFFHSLGHGVGLEVHEAPSLGRGGTELVAGDVVAVEPGLYRSGYGGVRLEDLVLVTEDGCENLTNFPYGLEP
jgi:Xaa-Pro aminopeptidase